MPDENKLDYDPNAIWIKAGKLVIFTSGAYSDYHLGGAYVVLRDVTNQEVVDLGETVKIEYSWDFMSAFEAACIREGWLLVLDFDELYLEDYPKYILPLNRS